LFFKDFNFHGVVILPNVPFDGCCAAAAAVAPNQIKIKSCSAYLGEIKVIKTDFISTYVYDKVL
jgi:hypothetical protein